MTDNPPATEGGAANPETARTRSKVIQEGSKFESTYDAKQGSSIQAGNECRGKFDTYDLTQKGSEFKSKVTAEGDKTSVKEGNTLVEQDGAAD